jgi:protein Mpv17
MSRLWSRYMSLLESQPVLTKACTSFTGFLFGDVLAQNFVEPSSSRYDYGRTFRLASFGFLIHGPVGHHFYKRLDGYFPGTSAGTVATKVIVDQVFWNPTFALLFFGYLNFAEGKGLQQYKEKVEADLGTAVVGSWAVWGPAHTVNFRFVPPNQRLLYINCVQVWYNVFLSFLGNKGVEEKGAAVTSEEKKPTSA